MPNSFAEKKRILKSLDNGKGVSFILNEGYKILGNPIVMFDTSYNLLTYVSCIATDDPLWNEIISLGTFSHETVDFFYSENFIKAYAQSKVVSIMTSDKLKYDRMNGKLFDKDGVQLGNICVTACLKPFEEGDVELFEVLSEILSVELQSSEFYQRIDRVYQESMLNDLIDSKNHDNELLKSKTTKLRNGLRTNLYLAVIDIALYDDTLTHLAYFRDLFRKIQPEYVYYIYLNNIVVIIDTDNPMLSIKKDLSGLNDFFAKYNIYAGISGGFQNLLELNGRFREAISALNYGLMGMNSRRIFKYDNFRAERFLNTVNADIREIFTPVIFLIREYDRENNTSLLKLLHTYLLNGKNSELVCRMMDITEEELIGQLKRLEETFEIDWDDGDMQLSIFISIKMLDDYQY